mmetsp:Transcript_18725/g.33264  ORF Transcript_18725/g.33264 Transcript_18725/m.33264 type:complete len:296 (+) Transcript_18725:156-1043(+)
MHYEFDVALTSNTLDLHLPAAGTRQSGPRFEDETYIACCLNKGNLVRGAALERRNALRIILDLSRVVHRQHQKQPSDLCVEFMAGILQDSQSLLQPGAILRLVVKAEITQVHTCNTTVSKDHFVLCQGASLVGEDKVDLAHLLHEIGSSCQGEFPSPWTPHLRVPVDLDAQPQLHNFEAYIEADGHNLVQDHPVENEALEGISIGEAQSSAPYDGVEAEGDQSRDQSLHPTVEVDLHVRYLGFAFLDVQPGLGLRPGVGRDRDYIPGVAKNASSRDKQLVAKLTRLFDLERSQLR